MAILLSKKNRQYKLKAESIDEFRHTRERYSKS